MHINLSFVFLWFLSLSCVLSSDDVDPDGGIYNVYDEENWVDPYDLTPLHAKTDTKEKTDADCTQVKKELEECKKKSESTYQLKIPVCNENTFLKHLIRDLLQKTTRLNDRHSTLHLEILNEDKDHLQSVLKSQDVNAKQILDKAMDAFQPITTTIVEKVTDNVQTFSWLAILVWALVNMSVSLLLIARKCFTRRCWSSLFFLMFLSSIPWNWYRMYKEKFAEKTASFAKDIPAECFPNSLTVYGSLKLWLKNTFSSENNVCVQYHKDLLVDPFWEVTPLAAVVVSVSTMVGEPLKYLFPVLGESYRKLIAETPLFWQPFIILVPIVFGVLFMMIWFGLEIKTLFFTIGFRNNRQNVENLQERNWELENRNRNHNQNPIAVEDLQPGMLQNDIRSDFRRRVPISATAQVSAIEPKQITWVVEQCEKQNHQQRSSVPDHVVNSAHSEDVSKSIIAADAQNVSAYRPSVRNITEHSLVDTISSIPFENEYADPPFELNGLRRQESRISVGVQNVDESVITELDVNNVVLQGTNGCD